MLYVMLMSEVLCYLLCHEGVMLYFINYFSNCVVLLFLFFALLFFH